MTTYNTVKKILHRTTIQKQSTTNTLIALPLISRVLLVYRTPGRLITTHTLISIH